MTNLSNYYLVSVSNKTNLNLCMKYGIAGFTNSINGLWTFLDINEGDYTSFLYGARVKNLYRVVKKIAYKHAEDLLPWPPITFKISGKTYYFPFRLYLRQERVLDEPMIRPEFAYVAENLLLRGGYRKTHFQADTVTFYNVSSMGEPFNENLETLNLNGAEVFVPSIVFKRELQKIPERFYFRELILQSLVKRKLNSVLDQIIGYFNLSQSANDFEILGEKALPEGYVDLLIKLKHPVGSNKYILVEVKTGVARKKDFDQLMGYVSEFNEEAIGGILIAKNFPKKINGGSSRILPIKYFFESLDIYGRYSFKDLLKMLKMVMIH
ncbi:MAG: hypothetical protein ACTSRP_25310 [Candidatus Helarchaeota archaeon]